MQPDAISSGKVYYHLFFYARVEHVSPVSYCRADSEDAGGYVRMALKENEPDFDIDKVMEQIHEALTEKFGYLYRYLLSVGEIRWEVVGDTSRRVNYLIGWFGDTNNFAVEVEFPKIGWV